MRSLRAEVCTFCGRKLSLRAASKSAQVLGLNSLLLTCDWINCACQLVAGPTISVKARWILSLSVETRWVAIKA